MIQPQSTAEKQCHSRIFQGLLLAGIFLIILATRLLIVEHFGTQVPFWDEWRCSPDLIFAAEKGELTLELLAVPWAEHRLIISKWLLAVTVQWNDHQWDSQVLQTINCLFSSSIPVLFLLIARGPRGLLGPHRKSVFNGEGALFLIVTLLWVTPVLWYSAVWAIQNPFYVHMLTYLSGVALVIRTKPFNWVWWLGMLLLTYCAGSVGSGKLAPMAVIAACILGGIQEKGFLKERRWTVVCMVVLIALAFMIQPEVQAKYADASHFVRALIQNLSWPWSFDEMNHALHGSYLPTRNNFYPFALLIWAPAPIWLSLKFLGLLRKDKEAQPVDRSWLVLAAFIGFAYIEVLAMAYGRGAEGSQPGLRHYDVLMMGVLLNLVALFRLCTEEPIPLVQRWIPARVYQAAVPWGLALYLSILSVGIAKQTIVAASDIGERLVQNAKQITNIKAYLATGDRSHITNQPIYEVPAIPLLVEDILTRRPDILPEVLRRPVVLTPRPEQASDPLAFHRNPVQDIPDYVTPATDPTLSRGVRFPVIAKPLRDYWSTWDYPENYRGRPKAPVTTWTMPRLAASYLAFPYSCVVSRSAKPKLTLSGPGRKLPKSETILKVLPWYMWGAVLVPVPKSGPVTEFRMDQQVKGGWLTFCDPIEVGRLTFWMRRFRGLALPLLALGIGLCLFVLIVSRFAENAGAAFHRT